MSYLGKTRGKAFHRKTHAKKNKASIFSIYETFFFFGFSPMEEIKRMVAVVLIRHLRYETITMNLHIDSLPSIAKAAVKIVRQIIIMRATSSVDTSLALQHRFSH